MLLKSDDSMASESAQNRPNRQNEVTGLIPRFIYAIRSDITDLSAQDQNLVRATEK